MADKIQAALKRAKHANAKFKQAEGWRAARNLAMLDAIDAGATQVDVAEALDMTQQAVSSVLRRTSKDETAVTS